jgi:hypothetical protein
MEHFLGRYAPYPYALMRIMSGVQYASHGAQKLFGVLGGVGDRRAGRSPSSRCWASQGSSSCAAGS